MTDAATDAATDSGPPTEDEDWKDLVRGAYNSLVRVRVVTVVGDIELVTRDDHNALDVDTAAIADEKALITETDLVGGDIVNLISDELVDNDRLRDFHAAQVAAALGVIPANVKMFVELAGQVGDLIR